MRADVVVAERPVPGFRTVPPAPEDQEFQDAPSAPPAPLAALVFTSGSTGAARAVRLTRANLEAAADASAARLGTTADDRWLLVLPLFHVGGLSVVVRAAAQGAALVVVPPDVRAQEAALDAGATVASFVPTQLARLVEGRTRPFPATVRAVLVGGAAASPALLARARSLGLPVLPTYGLTEAASQVATREPGDARDDAVGPPLAGTEMRVRDGAIEVRGPTVADGYEGDEEATRGAFVDGWLRTRDAGEVLPDGRLRVLGRLDDLVNTGGEKVAPAAVEAALLEHPAIAEACVVGVPDAEWGERVAAAVVLRDGAAMNGRELHAFLSARLSPVARPKLVRRVAELPKGPTGKVARAEVRAMLSGPAVTPR